MIQIRRVFVKYQNPDEGPFAKQIWIAGARRRSSSTAQICATGAGSVDPTSAAFSSKAQQPADQPPSTGSTLPDAAALIAMAWPPAAAAAAEDACRASYFRSS